MPARSQAQRAYLNARFGHEWVKRHDFDNKGKLPKRSATKNKHAGSKRERMIREFQAKHRGKKRG